MTIRISTELSHVCPSEEITKHATALDTLGFYRVWVPDTVVSPWEAWLAASLVMHHTSRIQIGLGVTNPYTRHPVVIAEMASTMQQYSGGRLTLSLGKGIGRFLEKAGITQHEKAVEECITVVRGLITGERISFSGNVFNIDAIRLRTRPPDTPVSIYLAAVGPTSWESAGRVADGVATFWSDTLTEMRRRFIKERPLPVAVLIPFAQSKSDFFEGQVTSLDQLRDRVATLEKQGIDEVIVAYGDMKDLETVAQLITKSD